MNKVILMGRLTRDPQIYYSQSDPTVTVARFRLAVNRRFQASQESADFINCIAFKKTAEFTEKYLHQGSKIVLCGRIQTGSYTNKANQTVYTTDIVVEEVDFAESKSSSDTSQPSVDSDGFMNIPAGLEDEDLPFK